MTIGQILVVVVVVVFFCVHLYKLMMATNEKIDAIHRYENAMQRRRDEYNHYWMRVMANYHHNAKRMGRTPRYDGTRSYLYGDIVSYKGILYKAIEPPYWADVNLGKTPNENCI